MQEFMYWLLRAEMAALSICIIVFIWQDAGQAFEEEIKQTKNQLRQQLASIRDTIFWT